MEENQEKSFSAKSFGLKVKIWRKKKGITQDMLAKKANMPYSTIAKIEANVIVNPSLGTATKIAKGLSISLNDLVK